MRLLGEADRSRRRRSDSHQNAADTCLQGVRLLLAVAGCALTLSAIPAGAGAKQMAVLGCHGPAGEAVGHDGWSNQRTSDVQMFAADSCAAGGRGELSLELGANGAGYPNGARTDWVFSAPAWGNILAYKIDVAGSYSMAWSGSGEGQSFVTASDEADPNYDYRNLAAGTQGATTIVRKPPAPDTTITLDASCDGQIGPCPSGQRIARLDVSGTEVTLNDPTSPTITAVSGRLTSSAPLSGEHDIAFQANDSGPGVYSAWLTVDGNAMAPQVLDTNSGWCQTLGSTATSMRSFAHPDPCPQQASGTLSLNTAGLSDGQHNLKLTVDDASGNTSTGLDATITTENAPAPLSPPTILPGEGPRAGSPLQAQTGSWSAPAGAGPVSYGYQWQLCASSGEACSDIPAAQSAGYTPSASDVGHTLRVRVSAADADGLASRISAASAVVAEAIGVPNGSGASPTASLTIAGPAAFTRPYSHRAFALRGRLVNDHGQPIGGASVEVSEQSAGATGARIAQLWTSSNGSFSMQVPGGPSRTLVLNYRAYSGQRRPSASAQVQEAVGAGVVLHVTPRNPGPQGKITLSGQVSGAVPPSGVIVELLVHYRGRWEPFRTPRTDRHGRFRATYRFQGAVGRFPFRAEVRSGQAGFPYADGASAAIAVQAR